MSNKTNKTTETVESIEKYEIRVNDYMCNGIKGIEKIKYENYNFNFEATEDFNIYLSDIEIFNKLFKVSIKFNVGRRTTSFLHTILECDGRRISLGFTNNMALAKDIINKYIAQVVR